MGAGHAQIVAQEIGQQHARLGLGLDGAAVEREAHAMTLRRRSGAASAGLLDGGAAHAAHEFTAITRGGVQIVARVELPGKGVEGVVERVAIERGKVAGRRPVGDAADGKPDVVLAATAAQATMAKSPWRRPNSRKA